MWTTEKTNYNEKSTSPVLRGGGRTSACFTIWLLPLAVAVSRWLLDYAGWYFRKIIFISQSISISFFDEGRTPGKKKLRPDLFHRRLPASGAFINRRTELSTRNWIRRGHRRGHQGGNKRLRVTTWPPTVVYLLEISHSTSFTRSKKMSKIINEL